MKYDELYVSDIKKIADDSQLDFSLLSNSTVLITGATGLIGSFLIDVLMYRNMYHGDNIKIIAMARNGEKIKDRFAYYNIKECDTNNQELLQYISHDISKPFDYDNNVDYVIHAASNTHPRAYSTDPVGTITTNVFGLYNLLEYGRTHDLKRLLLLSSVEIYGETRNDTEYFDEKYLGYIDCNTLRAGYPESKRLCEAMSQAYISKYDMDVVIGRLSRVYGPTLRSDDSKALSQFINKALNHENIVLKSDGEQLYSYSYMADAVDALLKILIYGKKGESYNISDKTSDVKLKDLAKILADYSGVDVVFELPDEIERRGYSTATKAIMDSEKLHNLGWNAHYDINSGLQQTMKILSRNKEGKE